ncbi:MAG TPA: enolase C-terminal domain-like protein, partial [Alphaproteobacteria bacterium]|nr:enolase C-terminal domain-like protein [Alphaproteobacteria bacterium]
MSRIAGIDVFTVPPRWIFVRVRTDDGRTGWGESIVPRRAGAVVAAIGDMARNLDGSDPDRIEDIAQHLRRGAFFRNGPILGTAAAGIEMALWDLKAKAHQLPVFEFLGGRVRDTIRSYVWIGGDTPTGVVEHARQRIAEGFKAVKMNATPAMGFLADSAIIDAVVGRMGALRDAFGMSLDIALDLHGRVHRAAMKPLLRELEPFRPMWVEEAVLPENEESLKVLARA